MVEQTSLSYKHWWQFHHRTEPRSCVKVEVAALGSHLCGHKATVEEEVDVPEVRSCVKVEVAALGSPSLIRFCGRKATLTQQPPPSHNSTGQSQHFRQSPRVTDTCMMNRRRKGSRDSKYLQPPKRSVAHGPISFTV